MAGMQSSAVSFLLPRNRLASSINKPLLSVSVPISASLSLKLSKRRNHLRFKILKTLTKPNPYTSSPNFPQLPQTDAEIQIVSPEISLPEDVVTELTFPVECCPALTGNGGDVDVSRLSESLNAATQFNFGGANFSWGSVLKFGVYFLAVFAFQTICAVWVFEYGNSMKEDKNSNKNLNAYEVSSGEMLLNGNEKEKIMQLNVGSKTSKLVYLEESKTREKIEEIRSMARKARKREKSKIDEDFGGDNSEDGNVISRARIDIEKEVDARLVKLQKRLNSSRERITESQVNYLFKTEKVEDPVERIDLNGAKGVKVEALTFKKKLKYKNSSNERSMKPKGFQGSVANRKNNGSKGKNARVEDEIYVKDVNHQEKKVDEEIEDEDDEINVASADSMLQSQTDRKKLDTGKRGKKTKPSNGALQETSSVEILEKTSQSFTKEKQTFTSAVSPMRSVNDSVVEGGGRGKQRHKKTDLWWLNLPYVLVIFMRRGSDDGLGGLFTMKIPSEKLGLENSTYTVAFEDRVDANNFCYLLESFFEDLGDFTADIVPLESKELENVVKSHVNNIVVVKKGELQLYVGQPFPDVEMALHGLIEQNKNIISLNPR